MFFHKPCGGLILAAKTIILHSGFNVTEGGLVIAGVPNVVRYDIGQKDLVCTACGQPVKKEAMQVRCSQCGEIHDVGEMLLHRKTNLYLCGPCRVEYFPEDECVSLAKLIK